MYCEKDVPKNFARLTGNHLCWSLFFNKVATLLKIRLQQRCFTVNFAKFLWTPFSIEHLRWLLLVFFFFSILLPRPIDFFVKNSLKTSAPYAREQRTRFRFYFFQYISFGLSRKTMIQPWKVLSHCFFYRLHLVSGTEIRAISHGWWNCSRWRSERHVSRNQTPCKQENHFQWWALKIKTYLFKVVFKTRKNAWNFIKLNVKVVFINILNKFYPLNLSLYCYFGHALVWWFSAYPEHHWLLKRTMLLISKFFMFRCIQMSLVTLLRT